MGRAHAGVAICGDNVRGNTRRDFLVQVPACRVIHDTRGRAVNFDFVHLEKSVRAVIVPAADPHKSRPHRIEDSALPAASIGRRMIKHARPVRAVQRNINPISIAVIGAAIAQKHPRLADFRCFLKLKIPEAVSVVQAVYFGRCGPIAVRERGDAGSGIRLDLPDLGFAIGFVMRLDHTRHVLKGIFFIGERFSAASFLDFI